MDMITNMTQTREFMDTNMTQTRKYDIIKKVEDTGHNIYLLKYINYLTFQVHFMIVFKLFTCLTHFYFNVNLNTIMKCA